MKLNFFILGLLTKKIPFYKPHSPLHNIQTQTVYGSNDIAKGLIIQERTLRKYCLILEENDHEFLKINVDT